MMTKDYEPLAARYRPRCFKDLIGQDRPAELLSNAIAKKRIAPAYLFSGPRGSGKTSAARIMAAALNCEAPLDGEPCGECSSCRSVLAGSANNLDVSELDAASNNGVADARELIERCQYAPTAGRYRVFILDEVHMLSKPAMNALLKTLEEPPERVVFILATTDQHALLDTVISRCQVYRFGRLANGAIAARLSDVASAESIEMTDEAAAAIAEVSSGGMRDAIALVDKLANLDRGIEVSDVYAEAGVIEPSLVAGLLERSYAGDMAALVVGVKRLLDSGAEPSAILEVMIRLFRDAAYLQAGAGSLVTADAKTLELVGIIAEAADVAATLSRLITAEAQLAKTAYPRLWLEASIIAIVSAKPEVSGKNRNGPEKREIVGNKNKAAAAAVNPGTNRHLSGAAEGQNETASPGKPGQKQTKPDADIWESLLEAMESRTLAGVMRRYGAYGGELENGFMIRAVPAFRRKFENAKPEIEAAYAEVTGRQGKATIGEKMR